MAEAKKHHYVPQFLLRQFADKNRTQIHVFDKRNEKSFRTNISNVAAENQLYDFQIRDVPATIEPSLAAFESKASTVLRKMLVRDCLGCLDSNERELLATFLALQILRSPNHRAMRQQFLQEMRDRITEMGHDPDALSELRVFDKNEEKLFEARMMNGTVRTFLPAILERGWVLHVVPSPLRIFISDNPVAMHNNLPNGPLGLAVDGVEIYVPVSATRCLTLYPRSAWEMLQRRTKLFALWPSNRQLPKELETGRKRADEWTRALRSGTPVAMSPEAVEQVNFLQVRNAERYVYSSTGEFDFVRNTLAEHPQLRGGPRATFA